MASVVLMSFRRGISHDCSEVAFDIIIDVFVRVAAAVGAGRVAVIGVVGFSVVVFSVPMLL